MAVEDAAVLGKLFGHLSSHEQIPTFLYAFQELRQSRVRDVRAGEFASAFFMTAEGPEAAERDASMREKAAKGKNVLEGEGSTEGVWEEYRVVFGYDCEDEADDWWVEWGVMQERAQHWTIHDAVPLVEVVELEEAKVLTGSVLSFSVSTTVESVG